MTAARNFPNPSAPVPQDAAALAGEPKESGVRLVSPHAQHDAHEFLSDLELQSLRPDGPPKPPPLRKADGPPEQPPTATETVGAQAVREPMAPPASPARQPFGSEHEYASLSLEVEGDEEVLALMKKTRSQKRRRWLVVLAFPAAIGAALYAVSGEGRPKDLADPMLEPAVSAGGKVATDIKREAAELAAARAEIAAAEAKAKAEAEAARKKARSPRRWRR